VVSMLLIINRGMCGVNVAYEVCRFLVLQVRFVGLF
jgi:hypothetical protein